MFNKESNELYSLPKVVGRSKIKLYKSRSLYMNILYIVYEHIIYMLDDLLQDLNQPQS